MCEAFVDPRTRRGKRRVSQACASEICASLRSFPRGVRRRLPLSKEQLRVGQLDHFGFGSWCTEPVGNERKNFVRCVGIALGGRFMLDQAMNADDSAIKQRIACNDKKLEYFGPNGWNAHSAPTKRPCLPPEKFFLQSAVLTMISGCASALSLAVFTSTAFAISFATLPPPERIEHALPSERLAASAAIGYQATYPAPRNAVNFELIWSQSVVLAAATGVPMRVSLVVSSVTTPSYPTSNSTVPLGATTCGKLTIASDNAPV